MKIAQFSVIMKRMRAIRKAALESRKGEAAETPKQRRARVNAMMRTIRKDPRWRGEDWRKRKRGKNGGLKRVLVHEIRRRADEGEPIEDIAESMEITERSARRIAERESYKNVPEEKDT